VRVWDAQSGAELAVLRGHEREVRSASFSPDGSRIASASEDKTVRVWDAQTGRCLEVVQVRGPETVIAQPDDGQTVAIFPVALSGIAAHPSGRAWAGGAANHLYIIRLEGLAENAP
jgi:WD40 repeat protein